MSVLTHISVDDHDLAKVFPDIADYKFEGQANFAEDILVVKRELYRDLRRQTGLEDDDLAKIKDFSTDTSLQDKVVYLTISNVMANNGRMDMAAHYQAKGDAIQYEYYVDDNADSTTQEHEKRKNNRLTFGR